MVSFYKAEKKSSSNKPKVLKDIRIDSLDMLGNGVCRSQQPVLFVEGALAGETVNVRITHLQKQTARAITTKVVTPSDKRQQPFCEVYQQCGGCQLQHVDADSALAERQQAMSEYWTRQFGLDDLPWQPALIGPRPQYRRKARLAIDGRTPGAIKLGYRRQGSNAVVDIPGCPVLVPSLQTLVLPLKKLLNQHSNSRHLGHIQMLAGDNVAQISLKTSRDLGKAMCRALAAFGEQHQCNVVLEDQHSKQHPLHHQATLVCHTEDNLLLTPEPDDFVQVNATVNQKMIAQAMAWLAPQQDEMIADWFAGLGNFALSLAHRGARVHAVEGVAPMVAKGQANAQAQGIDSIHWQHQDLSDPQVVEAALTTGFDKVILDPSREGAEAACQALARRPVDKVVYVSCNPSSFTRDLRHLFAGGYQVEKIGLVEMFPYTRHLEVMALLSFPRNATAKAS